MTALIVLSSAAGCGGEEASPQEPEAALQAGCDPSFGNGGIVMTNVGTSSVANAVAIQPDGKIVVAGYYTPGAGSRNDLVVVRYQADGTLDESFGDDGVVTTVLGDFDDHAHGLTIQPDGKIVVVGRHYTAADGSPTKGFLVVRYESDGSLDSSFGDQGVISMVPCDYEGGLFGVAVQEDGEIVGAGTCRYDFVVTRYDASGALDETFGDAGLVTTPCSEPNALANAVEVLPNSRILAAGTLLARYDSSGALDPDFGSSGQAVLAHVRYLQGIGLQPGGEIVVAGISTDGSMDGFVVARLDASGDVDASFGDQGVTTVGVGSLGGVAQGVATSAEGKVAIVGYVSGGGSSNHRWAVARLEADGARDETFAGTGATTTRLGLGDGPANAVAVQPDGKIVAVGYANVGGVIRIAVVRYLP